MTPAINQLLISQHIHNSSVNFYQIKRTDQYYLIRALFLLFEIYFPAIPAHFRFSTKPFFGNQT